MKPHDCANNHSLVHNNSESPHFPPALMTSFLIDLIDVVLRPLAAKPVHLVVNNALPEYFRNQLMREPIFGHMKRHDNPLGAPVAVNRAAKLKGHGTVEKLASITALAGGGRD
jgi:hypothetical protein